MFTTDSRALAKALDSNPKGTRKHDPENDDELLSPEFTTALDSGRYSVLKKFVMESIANQEGGKKAVASNKTSAAERSATETSSKKKGKNTQSLDENAVLASSSGSSSVKDVVLGQDKSNGGTTVGRLRKYTLGMVTTLIPGGLSDEEEEYFLDSHSLRRLGPIKTTLPSRTKPTGRNPAPKTSSDNNESLLQTTTLPTTIHHVDPPPILPQAHTDPSLHLPAAELPVVGPSRPRATLPAPSRDRILRSSKPVPPQEPRFRGPTHPSTANSHPIKPDPDELPSNAASITPNPEPRDPTPDVQELPAPPNSNSSAVRSFLSSLQPPLIQYAPAFEKLGVKNSDDLVVLKRLSPASVREFLHEVRKETEMTFLQSLAFIGGLEGYSP